MPIQLSPGVAVVEKDFTNIVPTVASSAAAVAGAYSWGPVLEPTTISSENELVAKFGKPTDTNAQSWFTAANFLSYSSNLLNIRTGTTAQKNAVSSGTASTINNRTVYEQNFMAGVGTIKFTAKYPGALGNSIAIAVADAATFKSVTLSGTVTSLTSAATLTGGTSGAAQTKFLTELYVGAIVKDSTGATVGTVASITSDSVATLSANALVALTNGAIKSDWQYASQFSAAPGTSSFATQKGATTASDELHILVIDSNGEWTGIPGTILEKFPFVSKAVNAKTDNGTSSYYKNVLNNQSNYVWWTAKLASDWDTTLVSTTTYTNLTAYTTYQLTGGVSDLTSTAANQLEAYNLIANPELYPIAYIAAGKAAASTVNTLISNIAEVRKDIIVFASPEDSTGDVLIGNGSDITTKVVAYRDSLPSSSYAVLDSGYKYQYDRYNDVYRWIPLNGDTAGLCARTDSTNDPWFSPGGYTRGQVKNVVKLAYNPDKNARDAIYSSGVNPVVSFPGQGVVLYGDKTLLAKPSAFDRIGTRRLFIILEKSISVAAKYQLFEYNDSFTRAQFKNMLEPFLRDIQGRRGITDFQVVCDTTNNTAAVIESYNFIADIYIKPNYSINYITLNFIAARQSVEFSTVGA
jgi:phage tail sheath protein FI